MSDTLIFADEGSPAPTSSEDSWKLFIVDDDQHIHEITKLALRNLKFKDRPISFVSAYSAKEAIELLKTYSDFAIILLDIGMETKDAGLEVANFIRQQLHDDITRIIIRTGQPGDVPEKEIIDTYDINDYKSKTELTVEKLFNAIRTAIAQYDQINELAHLNEDLENRIRAALDKQQEQQEALFLQNRSAQMGELLSMLAHQWRQPLALISAVTSQLKLSLALGEINAEEFDKQIDGIEQYTHDLSHTIDEFRMVYEPASNTDKVPLRVLLEKSMALIQNACVTQHIKIDLVCENTEKETLVSTALYQVILSILKNSQEAFLEKDIEVPHINISVSDEQGELKIRIEDNAGGIEEENIKLVFDPYFSTKKNRNGPGLGLYMSKNIIEQQFHGQLSCANTDNGACFTISLANK